MILIGQYDSSFVRRCAIAMRIYNLEFRHEPWSTFGDADQIRAYNPLTRVPTLVLDNGDVLNDSYSIIDYIDSIAPHGKLLMPKLQPERHQVMAVMSLATGLADKVVALFYELRLHEHPSELLIDRSRTQIIHTLDVLEKDRARREDDFWFGDRITHADIAVACTMQHLAASHPDILVTTPAHALNAHCAKMEAMPVFKEIYQAFIPPS
ncbi:MAG: glutathione S-transferase family protein [Rhizobiaceae bacterium]